METKKSLLSDKAILEHMKNSTIIIEPFCRENLSTSSYDVTLGRYYFRESHPEPGMAVYNPYSRQHVERVWGEPLEAELAGEWVKRTGTKLDNIQDDDRIIWITPGETILGHTIEWLGGRSTVTTMMKARSSMGRNFIEVCKCAGWGDVGYINRWTMEITNNSRYYSIPLVVGRRIAQIVFFDTDGTVDEGTYSDKGKYQSSMDLSKLKVQWRPVDCLPKMYKDREIEEGPISDPYPFAFLTPSPAQHKPKGKKSRQSHRELPSKTESDSHDALQQRLNSSVETLDDLKSSHLGELDFDVVTPNEKSKKSKRVRPLDFGTGTSSSISLPQSWDSPVTVSSLSSSPSPLKIPLSPASALRSLSETHHSQTLSESTSVLAEESRASKRVRSLSEERD